MKQLFFLSAVVSLLFTACAKSETEDPQPQPDTQPTVETQRFYISDEATEAAANPSSRAYFDEGYRIAWETGDQVAVFNGTKSTHDMAKDESGWYVTLPSAEEYTVYYPAAAARNIIDGIAYCFLSNTQTYRAGSFDKTAFCARAVAKPGEKLVFKYLCSLVKVTLKGTSAEQVKTIHLSTDEWGDERISYIGEIANPEGDAYLRRATNTDYAGMAANYVTLTADNVALTAAGVDFYLAIMPVTFSKGFTLAITLADGRTVTKKGGVGQSANRGKIFAMPALTLSAPVLYSTDNKTWTPWYYRADGVTPETLAYPTTTDHILYFKNNPESSDAGLKAAHFTSLRDTFLQDAVGSDITTARAVHPIGFDFRQATYESTTLPAQVFNSRKDGTTVIYNLNLRYIWLPSNITTIPTFAFGGDLVLRKVVLPASVNKIESFAFAIARGFENSTDIADTSTNGVYCYATTPPQMNAESVQFVKNLKFYVPASAYSAYVTAWGGTSLGLSADKKSCYATLVNGFSL